MKLDTSPHLPPSASALVRPGTVGWCGWVFAAAQSFLRRPSFWALADQVVVSGMSFFTTILVGRLAGPAELGVYSLGFSIAVVTLTVLHALVTLPYTIYANRVEEQERSEWAGASLLQFLLLAVMSSAGVGLWAFVRLLQGSNTGNNLTQVIGIVALVLPFLLLREFARRLTFAHLAARQAFTLDFGVGLVQVFVLGFLAWTGRLTALTALLCLGTACGVLGLTWLCLQRRRFVIRREKLKPAWFKSWKFGRWVFGGQLVSHLNSDILILWLLVFFLGESATGEFAACMTIVLFSNPFLLGISQVLTPQAAREYSTQGAESLRRYVIKMSFFLGGVMAAFCVVVTIAGEWGIQLLYGDQYIGNGLTIAILGISLFLGALVMAVGNGLWALERSDVNFASNLLSLFVTVPVAVALLMSWGLVGAAMALVCGRVVELISRWLAFRRLILSTVPAAEALS